MKKQVHVDDKFTPDSLDRIDAVLDASWRFKEDKRESKTVYINVVNCDPDKIEQDIDI